MQKTELTKNWKLNGRVLRDSAINNLALKPRTRPEKRICKNSKLIFAVLRDEENKAKALGQQ